LTFEIATANPAWMDAGPKRSINDVSAAMIGFSHRCFASRMIVQRPLHMRLLRVRPWPRYIDRERRLFD